MKDEQKTKLQLIQELNELRRKISKFNAGFSPSKEETATSFSGTPAAENILKSLKDTLFGKFYKRETGKSRTSPKKSTQLTRSAVPVPEPLAQNRGESSKINTELSQAIEPTTPETSISPYSKIPHGNALAPTLILITDFTGKIESVSAHVSQFFGAESPDFLLGQSFLDFIAPGHRKLALKTFEKIKKTGNLKNSNLLMLRSDGSTFNSEFSAVLDKNQIVLTLHDVDRQQHKGRALRGKEDPYQFLLNTLQQPMVATNADLMILHFNDAFSRFLAKPNKELKGLNLLKAFPDFMDTPFYSAALDTLSTGLAHEVQEWHRSRLVNTQIFRTADGLLLKFEDLTRQRQSEIELLQSEARFRLITENIQDGILLFEDNVLTYINKRTAEILGYPLREFLNLWNQNPDASPELRKLQPHFQTSVKTSQEVWFTRKDGSHRCLKIRSTSRHEKASTIKRYFVLSDITQQKQAEQALHSRNQILAAISEAALILLQSIDYVEAIQKTIEILGKATKVSRIFLSQSPENSTTSINNHRFNWQADKVQSSSLTPHFDVPDINHRYWEYWKKDLSDGKPIVSPLVLSGSSSRTIKQIYNIVVIPIFIAQKLWGYLGFVDDSSQRTWSQVEIDALKSAGSVIGSTLLRYHTESLQHLQKILGLKLGTISELKTAYKHLLASIVQIDGIDCGAIFQIEPDTKTFRLIEQKNLPCDFEKQVSTFFLSDPEFKHFYGGNAFFLREKKATSFPRILPKDKSFKAVALIPIRIQQKVNAALYLASQTFGEISPETANILETLGAQLGGIITRIQTQEALTTSQKNLQILFNSVDDFLLIFTLEGRVLHFNPAIQMRLGYTHDLLLQLRIHQIFANTPAPEINQIFGQLRHETAVLCQFPLVTKKGEEIPAETKISKGDWDGKSVYFGISRDNSERKAVELELENYRHHLEQLVQKRTEELQNANADLKSFACTVSHDLKTPLRAMTGFAQILQENYADKLDAEGKLYLQRITDASQRMDALLLDLMAYSRLNQAKIQCHSIDLNQILNEILEQHQNEILNKQAIISVRNPLPSVYGHPMILEQILTNLIQNGLKFVPPERTPQIHIWAEKKPAFYRIWVEDNGIGIEEKYFTQIFNPFERLHPAKTFPGTGIGLAIVRKAVERLGGHSGVESTPDVGSKFWIELKESPPAS